MASFSGSLLTKNRAALEEIASAMALDHRSVKLRTELIEQIRSSLIDRQDELSHDDRFAKLYVKPKQGRPSSKPRSFKEEGDLTAEVQVPFTSSTTSSDASDPAAQGITSSYLASQASSAAASAASKATARRSPRLSSAEPGSPRKHSQQTASVSTKGTPGRRGSSRLSRAALQSSDDDDDNEDDEVAVAEKLSSEGSIVDSASDSDALAEAEGEGSFAQSSLPLSSLAEPLSSVLHSITSPLAPALSALASPLKTARRALGAELERAKAVVDGVEERVEGVVEGAGFKVVEVAQRAERAAGRAVSSRSRQAKAQVEETAERVASVPSRAFGALKRTTVEHPAFWQTASLLCLEALALFIALAPLKLHTASFPPSGPLLAPIDRRTDFAHLYDGPPSSLTGVARPKWLTVVYPLPTWPAEPLALLSALVLWALSTILLPASLAPLLETGGADSALVFWLVRSAGLALLHVGWRAEGFGSGSGRTGAVLSLLGVGLGVARGLGEAKVGGVVRR